MSHTHPLLIIVTFMLLASFIMLGVSTITDIDSNYDLFFETNTLVIVLYICTVAKKSIGRNKKLKYGAWLLLFNKTYDVITEIAYLDRVADQYEFIDTFLEDGLLQISFLLIAFGLTEITLKLREQNSIDELTGLYNRKKLTDIKLKSFDLIYFDLNGLKLVNDRKGHSVGDLMLVRFSQVLAQCTVGNEMAFRVGGDEFVITANEGRAEELIAQVKNLLDGEQISFSYGIEHTSRENFHQALDKSDKAMYEMKKSMKTDNHHSTS